ncbi:hypothetical protein L2249_25955, partial [Xanthomonas perforans]|nr:hypothetical protein [Xanthomonas perforans]
MELSVFTHAAKPTSPAGHRRPIRNFCGNVQFHFGTGGNAISKCERGTDACSALAHAGQSPVTGPHARGKHFGRDAAAIITDTQAQRLGAVMQFERYGARLCMVERIDEGLASDAEHLVMYQWIERS